jgi:hypothetical protein
MEFMSLKLTGSPVAPGWPKISELTCVVSVNSLPETPGGPGRPKQMVSGHIKLVSVLLKCLFCKYIVIFVMAFKTYHYHRFLPTGQVNLKRLV